MSIEIRLATADDVQDAARVYIESFVTEYGPLDPINCWWPFHQIDPIEEQMEGWIEKNTAHEEPQERVHVITFQDCVVGMCHGTGTENKAGEEAFEINQIALDPEYTGFGLGSTLMLEAAKHYRDLGYDYLIAHGTRTSERAHRFFEARMGGKCTYIFVSCWNPGGIEGAGADLITARYGWNISKLLAGEPKAIDPDELPEPVFSSDVDDDLLHEVFERACRELPANKAIAEALSLKADELYTDFMLGDERFQRMRVEMVPSARMQDLTQIRSRDDLFRVDYNVILEP